MVTVQKRSQRKPSGARYKVAPTKRTHQKGSVATRTVVGAPRKTLTRVKGGNQKNHTLSTNTINVYDEKSKKHTKATIASVSENSANRNFVRRNIMTKGTIVETSVGKVKITNRPGQEGTVNGIKI